MNHLDNKNIAPTYSIDTVYQIWNDKTGERIEIGPDPDGLDLVEIRCYSPTGERPQQFVTLNKEQATLVLAALQRTLS